MSRQEAMTLPTAFWDEDSGEEIKVDRSHVVGWTRAGDLYSTSGEVVENLPGGVYSIIQGMGQIFFKRMSSVNDETLINIDDSYCDAVLSEIDSFWKRKEIFARYGFIYKRGILLYGPPGAGKTSIIRLAIDDVTTRGGIVIKFGSPDVFVEGINDLRRLQPDTPIVVVIEDIDSLFDMYGERSCLDILDGVHKIDNVIFIATTNYLERLSDRIKSRPSRFDRRIMIDNPSPIARRHYVVSMFSRGNDDIESRPDELNKWVDSTVGFSYAHIKELFVSTVVLGNEFDTTLELLKEMIIQQVVNAGSIMLVDGDEPDCDEEP